MTTTHVEQLAKDQTKHACDTFVDAIDRLLEAKRQKKAQIDKECRKATQLSQAQIIYAREIAMEVCRRHQRPLGEMEIELLQMVAGQGVLRSAAEPLIHLVKQCGFDPAPIVLAVRSFEWNDLVVAQSLAKSLSSNSSPPIQSDGSGPLLHETKSARTTTRSNEKGSKPRVTKAEANVLARDHLTKNPYIKLRELAKLIGCSHGLICELPSWRVVQAEYKKGRKPKGSRVVRLTNAMQAAVGCSDEQLEALINGEVETEHRDRRTDRE